MKKIIIFIMIFFSFISCKKTEITNLPPLTSENISGKSLWNRIIVENNYKKYKMWPDHEGLQEGQSPHGRFHKIYINKQLYNSLPIPDKVAPYDSIIVEENYNIQKELRNIDVMIKIADYNPDFSDWFWATFTPDGKIVNEGQVENCIDCHLGMFDNDFIIVHPLDKSLDKKEINK
ncbi:MAG: hypothetical protein A2086_12815 [Spirochaetes bacterium GWD1_27_9]|nr:MAG: hypothetical protein A2Z98_00615 [Spirochaetes bacterium GWB1_27_13]OHD20542.1 MAG: hypothetical protein A2Y34_14320 [Spirochaetes bacterium GWC1_27_15]OHD43959.1 MAG: hypothetical protein A2086_12815 [Spirochaetes bacterium GWD1_27_9]